MQAAIPYIDRLLPIHNLASLEQLVATLDEIERAAHAGDVTCHQEPVFPEAIIPGSVSSQGASLRLQ